MKIRPSPDENDIENFLQEEISAGESAISDGIDEEAYIRKPFFFYEASDLLNYKSSQRRNLDVRKICRSITSF